jgi:hypothetical protein
MGSLTSTPPTLGWDFDRVTRELTAPEGRNESSIL